MDIQYLLVVVRMRTFYCSDFLPEFNLVSLMSDCSILFSPGIAERFVVQLPGKHRTVRFVRMASVGSGPFQGLSDDRVVLQQRMEEGDGAENNKLFCSLMIRDTIYGTVEELYYPARCSVFVVQLGSYNQGIAETLE